MAKIAWFAGKLLIGIFLSLLYIKFLFLEHILEFHLLGGSKNMGFYIPALLSGPLFIFLLTSKKMKVIGVALLLLMVILPCIDLYNQAVKNAEQVVLDAEYEKFLTEENRKQAEAEQAALQLIREVYPGEITAHDLEGRPWGDCTTILARIKGIHDTVYYDYDPKENRIIGMLTKELLMDAIQKYIKGASDIHIVEDDFGFFAFTYKLHGEEKSANANINYNCGQLSMDSILLTDDDRKLIPAAYDFRFRTK